MSYRSFEIYNEYEYLLKFLKIHPTLTYSTNNIDIKKKEYFEYLLNQFNLEIITYDELSSNINNLLILEKNNKIILEDIRYYHKQIENNIISNSQTQISNIINNLLKK